MADDLPLSSRPELPQGAGPKPGYALMAVRAMGRLVSRLGWRLNLFLLLATLGTTTLCGAFGDVMLGAPIAPVLAQLFDDPMGVLASGLSYSLPVLLILGSHEMGHYVLCRYYGVRATLPYFIPAPGLFGTFGAVIRMHPPIPSRKALFDIGIAGPIAGFVVAVPVLAYGIATARIEALPQTPGAVYVLFGDPMLSRLLTELIRGPVPDSSSLVLNPFILAGWFGLLVTAMNLFPVGQLDGGHVVYALSGRLHAVLSRLTIAGMLILVAVSFLGGMTTPWLIWTILLLLLGRRGHPPVEVESEPAGPIRRALGVAGLVIFVLSFVPVPIEQITIPG